MLPRFLSFGRDTWDPTHRFETSWLLPPWALFAIRALFSLYAFTTLFFNIGWGCTHAANTTAGTGGTTVTTTAETEPQGRCATTKASFSYFTVLTYWGMAFYLLFAALHTATYAFSSSSSRKPLLARFPRPLQALHALFYTTITTYPLLVTIVYWAVLYPTSFGKLGGFPTTYAAWSNVSQHALNSAFALFEIALPRTRPAPPLHLAWLIIILALYLALAYVTLATEGFYVYPFLDPAGKGGRKSVTGYIFGILAAVIVIFGVVWGLVWTRRWVTEQKLGLKGKFAAGDEDGAAAAATPEKEEKASRIVSRTDPEMAMWTGNGAGAGTGTETVVTAK